MIENKKKLKCLSQFVVTCKEKLQMSQMGSFMSKLSGQGAKFMKEINAIDKTAFSIDGSKAFVVKFYFFQEKKIEFKIFPPSVSYYLKHITKVEKCSAKQNVSLGVNIKKEYIKQIAKIKLPYILSYDLEQAEKKITQEAIKYGFKIIE